jgi:hypothetical protein
VAGVVCNAVMNSARSGVNLIPNSGDFTLWTPQGTPDVAADGTLGGASAFSLTDNDAAAWEAVRQTIPGPYVSGAYTFRCRVKKNGAATSAAAGRIAVTDGGVQFAGFIVNPISGVSVTGAAWNYGGRVVTVGDGGDHWRVTVSFTIAGTFTDIVRAELFPAHYSLDALSAAATNVGSNTFAAPSLVRGAV